MPATNRPPPANRTRTAPHARHAAAPAANLVSMSHDESARPDAPPPRRPREYLDMAGVGAWFGVPGTTVSQWRYRYRETHPIPEPDVIVGRIPGWDPSREQEWRQWEAGRPGRGAGGGRPRKNKAPQA